MNLPPRVFISNFIEATAMKTFWKSEGVIPSILNYGLNTLLIWVEILFDDYAGGDFSWFKIHVFSAIATAMIVAWLYVLSHKQRNRS